MSSNANQILRISTPEHLQNPGAQDGQFTLNDSSHLERIGEVKSSGATIVPFREGVLDQMRIVRARQATQEQPNSRESAQVQRKSFWDK